MGRKRNPKRDKAYDLWAESGGKRKLADIAAELEVPESRVRKWKSEDKWENKIKEQNKKERSKKPHRKAGAPKGNKNAVGNKGGGPTGNTFALKHGGYSSIYWDTLSDEERAMIEDEEHRDVETQLIDQIKLCTVREHRLMKALKKYEDIEFKQKGSGLAVESVSTIEKKRLFPDRADEMRYEELRLEKVNEGKISYLGREQNIQTITEATYNIIARLQAELTRVQKQKTQCIRELAEINARKTSGDEKNSIATAWKAAVEKASKKK